MKVYLFNTGTISEKHLDSLAFAIRFFGGVVEVISNYAIEEIENAQMTQYDDEQLIERLKVETDNVLVAHSQTVFAANALLELSNAYAHFSIDKKIMIQLPINNVMLVSPKPTLPIYGGGRFWLSGTQLFINQDMNIPVAFGDAQILYEVVSKNYKDKPYFHDFIFYNGDTGLLTAFPPLAFDMRFDEVPTFQGATLNQDEYLKSIPDLTVK